MAHKKIAVPKFTTSGGPEAHLASRVLMVRPMRFGFNEETALSNPFQKNSSACAQDKALEEFNRFVSLLESSGVEVIVVEDTTTPHTPDSIFPNNWFSTHSTGELVLYPMCAPNRRLERKEAPLRIIKELGRKSDMTRTVDLSAWEAKGQFLEGTGSMVLDRANKIAFVCRSPRSDEAVLERFCEELGYRRLSFDALDRNGSLIYHANIMMCMGDKFVVVCLDSIRDNNERKAFIELADKLNKDIIEISIEQMECFAGNMLQLKNQNEESILAMSLTAKQSLNVGQLKELEKHCTIIAPDINTIETCGGGSVRFMIAEMFF